jgi:hypothetical protein
VAGVSDRLEMGLSMREWGQPGDPRPARMLFGTAAKLQLLAPREALPGLALSLGLDRFNRDPIATARLTTSVGLFKRLRLAAFVGAEAGIERKRLPLREHGGTASEALDADLGALQVAEHRHVLADCCSGLPNGLHPLAVIARLAVREIDTDDIGPAADDVLEDAGRVGGRAQGGDDFRATKHKAAVGG